MIFEGLNSKTVPQNRYLKCAAQLLAKATMAGKSNMEEYFFIFF